RSFDHQGARRATRRAHLGRERRGEGQLVLLRAAGGDRADAAVAMPKLPDIHLPTSLKDRLAQGHPWVYGRNLPPGPRMGAGRRGLTVDLYGDWAVVQTYMDGAEMLLGWLVAALREIASLRGIVLRGREQELVAPRTESQEPRTENQEPRTIIVGRRSSV